MPIAKQPRTALMTGGLAAILASTCCLGPLVLVMLGVSGAWIGNLALLEPYRPVFLSIAVTAMFFAYRRIYRSPQACKADQPCAKPGMRAAYRVFFWLIGAMIVVALAFPYVLPFFY